MATSGSSRQSGHDGQRFLKVTEGNLAVVEEPLNREEVPRLEFSEGRDLYPSDREEQIPSNELLERRSQESDRLGS